MGDAERTTRPLDTSSRESAAAAGWAATKTQAEATATELETESTRRVESQRFSWLTRKVLVESRNDLFVRAIHDVVKDERPRWVAAQRAAGVSSDLVIDRTDLGELTCLLLGDPGEGDRSQRAVAEAIPRGERESDFTVVVSDVIYPSGDVNEYAEKFYEMYGDYPKPIYALPGNHDWYDGLDGLMWHFCGAEPLGRVSHRLSSFPLREWLVRVLWRRSSRPDRGELLAQRDGLWAKSDGHPPQPAPYWVIETKHLALVAIDTGVKGTLDHEQGRWLRGISRAIGKPKVLLTGKPIYVSGAYHPCPIEWAEGAPERVRYPTVDDIVRDPDHRYVAAIGGDIHNYQRYAVPVRETGSDGREVERTIQYVVSGGAGAYMSETHLVPLADELAGPPRRTPLDEARDLRLYPLRGDSLAFYSEELVFRARGFLASAVIWLIGAVALAVLLLGQGWALNDMTWLAGVATTTQLASALVARPERRSKLLAYTGAFALLTLGLALFASRSDEWGTSFSIWLLTLSAALVPALVLAVLGRVARGLAGWLALLLSLTLLTYLVDDDAIGEIVRGGAIAILVATVLGAIAYGCARLRRTLSPELAPKPEVASRRAKESVESAPGLVVAGAAVGAFVLVTLIALVFGDYLDVFGAAMLVLAVVPLAYVVWIGGLELALSFDLRRAFRTSRERIADSASKYVAERLHTDLDPVRRDARDLEAVDKRLRRLFDLTYPRSKLKRTAPFHHFISEILDRDRPPLFKNFLELEVRTRGLRGHPELRIRAYGVPGVPVGSRRLEDRDLDDAPIPL